ncbi:hypothetical protein AAC387_Pa08g1811 [Persea americana]
MWSASSSQSQLAQPWYEVGQVHIHAKEGEEMDLVAFSDEMVDGKISPASITHLGLLVVLFANEGMGFNS